MIRPLLTEIAFFLVPFLLYAVFLIATRAGVFDPESWSWPVIGTLTIVALALVFVSFFVLAQFYGAPPHSSYVPAHMEDGRLVPGGHQ